MLALEKSSSATFCAAFAINFFSCDLVDDVGVIPTELLSGGDVTLGKEGDPRKAQVMRVHEAVLNENVGTARVVEVATDVPDFLGVHDVDVLVFAE